MDAFIPSEAAISPAQWPPTDEQIRRFASTGFSRAGYQIPRAFLNGTTDYLRQQPLPDRLAVLGRPLLVIFGEDDRRWRASSAADYLAVPGARVELLPGVGHTPILQDPERTAALLLSFTVRTG
ncbi:alpha/beta fold hydrolase [Nonomuraea sp. CA-218870]|uniref:alpha/beta fold hydrolase n=1 Tax=Nonomuraea sp. CA-218870 TaxID=3239998 RepID=UPI003D8B9E48